MNLYIINEEIQSRSYVLARNATEAIEKWQNQMKEWAEEEGERPFLWVASLKEISCGYKLVV